MHRRGYRHHSSDDQFTIRGEYALNLQYVYSKEIATECGLIIDLIYFAVDIHNEKLVIGLYRENTEIENGVMVNTSRSLPLSKFSRENVSRELDKLIPKVWEKNF